MKQSLLLLFLFAAGVVLSLLDFIPEIFLQKHLSEIILYFLLFFVGIQIGTSKRVFAATRQFGAKIILVPLATTVGTFAGVALISLLLPQRSFADCLSVGAGFAYYSLSSILITEFRGAELGAVALLANIMREFFVLIFAPRMVKYFGKLAPVCGGGATTMDTTLPIITASSGEDYVVIALFHGMIIDFSVPLWVSFFLSL